MPTLVTDLREALGFHKAILGYALADLRIRFDRTVLGPMWIIVTNFIWVISVGFVVTTLFNQNLADQLPYLTFGVFAWSYIMSVLSESSNTFNAHRDLLLGYRIPIMFCVLRAAVRNGLILSMLTLVAGVIALFFGLLSVMGAIGAVLCVAIYFALSIPVILILGIVGTRFLDLSPLMAILLNILVIVTPIFWNKSILPRDHGLVALNPLTHVIDLYRDTFLYGAASAETYETVLLIALSLWIAAAVLFQIKGHRVRNWL